jgi:hypothetical protein
MLDYRMREDFKTSPEVGAGRKLLHSRHIHYRVYARDDGHWDVEGSLRDVKDTPVSRPSMRPLNAGDTVHDIAVMLTVDDDLRVLAASGQMHTVPFEECQQARSVMAGLLGHKLARGWRRALENAMCGERGCTHMRELLQGLATAGIQGIGIYKDQQRRERGLPDPWAETAPHFVGGCLSWRRDGPVVQRVFPQFALPGPHDEAPQ